MILELKYCTDFSNTCRACDFQLVESKVPLFVKTNKINKKCDFHGVAPYDFIH